MYQSKDKPIHANSIELEISKKNVIDKEAYFLLCFLPKFLSPRVFGLVYFFLIILL